MIHIDVESFSLLDVREVGAFRYWEHPSTEVLCMCYAFDDGPVHEWRMWEPPPHELCERIRRGDTCGAHNATFEALAFRHHLGPAKGFPVPTIKQWVCTAARAAAVALPRALDKALAAMGSMVRKDKRGAALINRFCKPRRPTKNDPGSRVLPWEDPVEFDALVAYCAQDVRGERELHHMLPPLCPREEVVWRFDFLVNQRGIPLDVELIDRMIELSDKKALELHHRAIKITGGIRPSQREKILEWANANGADLQTLQAKELGDALKSGVLPPVVAELITIRLEAAKVSTKKLVAAKKCMSDDGRIRGTLLYHGATPGRWAGRLLQPHNFPRGTFNAKDQQAIVDYILSYQEHLIEELYAEPMMEAISFALRGIIAVPDGRRMFVADYSQIEARNLVWLAGQQDAVERYRKKIDQYKIMASVIFGIPVEQINTQQRKVGKDVILGCGYQMGGPKFAITCEQRGAPISQDLADRSVKAYREKHPKVVRHWRRTEDAAVEAVLHPGRAYSAGFVRYIVEGRFLYCQLPSGRRIAYPDPEVQVNERYGDFKNQVTFMGENAAKQWVRQPTYGGKLVENHDQAISRDMMAEGAINAECAGYEVFSTVHDEVLSERGDGKGSVEEYEKLLCDIPNWGAGSPVAAEGYSARRWRK